MVDWKDKMYDELAEVSEDIAEKYFKAIIFNISRLIGDAQAEAYTKLILTSELYADGVKTKDLNIAVVEFMQSTEEQLNNRIISYLQKSM